MRIKQPQNRIAKMPEPKRAHSNFDQIDGANDVEAK